jgi:hypothetical protein
MYIPTPGLDMAVLQWWSRWVRRGRAGRAEFLPAEPGWALIYTSRYRVTVSLVFAGFTALYVAAFATGVLNTSTPGDLALFAGSVLLWLFFATIVGGALVERVVVTPQHLRRRSWRGRQEVAWARVTSLKLEDANAVLTVCAADGASIRVSFYLDGLWAVADALEQHLGVPLQAVLANVVPQRLGSAA